MLCRNTIDVAAYGLQTAIVVMHLSRTGINSNELSIIMAIQVLLLWIKVQYYARYLSRNAPWLIHAGHIAPSCISCTHNPFENSSLLPPSMQQVRYGLLEAHSVPLDVHKTTLSITEKHRSWAGCCSQPRTHSLTHWRQY